MEILGIDVGGSGIKGAVVDTKSGKFVTDRHRIPTPQPATPDAVTDVIAEIVEHFEYNGAVGCTFPAIVKEGTTYSAANIDDGFIGADVQRLVQRKTGCPVVVLNDADAAGIAEMNFGAGRGANGVTMVLTIGTGIGSSIFTNGVLLPNTELGHIYLNKKKGIEGEDYASDRIRDEKGLSWKKWGKRLNRYLQHVDFIFSPDLIILGGGVSKKHTKYFKYIDVNAQLDPAQLRNRAGIVGAALAAEEIT